MSEVSVVPLELRQTAENTLEGVCIPYGVTTMKAGYPNGERFVPHAFADVATAHAKIRLTDQHDETGRRPVGVAVRFQDHEDGLLGTFRFYNTPEGRGARENVIEETYGGLSVGFLPVEERTAQADGAREVVKARLFHVSLVDEPAYEDARILAVRHALPDVSALLAVEYDLGSFPDPVDVSRVVFGSR
jgi:hypothetical protein